MLGTDMCEVLGTDYAVIPCDIEEFDVVDLDATLKAVREVSPEVIIHLAAFADVEACEGDTELPFMVNSVGTKNVATAAKEVDAYLVYLSTDYVFDGAKGEPYIETDEPNPINQYGLTKLRGEHHVQDIVARHLIVRTSWLFGPNGKNFVDTIVAKAAGGAELKVVNDQRGPPTYTMDLARGIRQAFEREVEGFLHMANVGVTTWFDLAVYAIKMAGIAAEVKPVPSEEYPTAAARPPYSELKSIVRAEAGIDPLPHWEDGVKHHLKRRECSRKGRPSDRQRLDRRITQSRKQGLHRNRRVVSGRDIGRCPCGSGLYKVRRQAYTLRQRRERGRRPAHRSRDDGQDEACQVTASGDCTHNQHFTPDGTSE